MTAPDESAAEEPRAEVAAWNTFVDGLRTAGEQLAGDTAGLPETERVDGFRALLRALSNQLGRFEVDRDKPDLIAFNGWRQKFLMDNPDFHYWVADIRPDGRYRIRGNRGDASYVSITVYGPGGSDAKATARIDSDAITFEADGGYEVAVGGERPQAGDWLDLPERATVIWVRHFHDEVQTDRLGRCDIEPVELPPGAGTARSGAVRQAPGQGFGGGDAPAPYLERGRSCGPRDTEPAEALDRDDRWSGVHRTGHPLPARRLAAGA